MVLSSLPAGAMEGNRDVFNEIARSWYGFRHRSRFTRELEEMASRWRRGRLLNIGCAHGPDFLPFKNSFELWGVDFSAEMVRLARGYARKFNFQVSLAAGDALFLPYADSAFDWAIAVATYHHIQGDSQPQAFRELRRVLQPGGEAFITVWNRWQPRFWLKRKEVNVAWKSRQKTLYRYYYLFSYPELRRKLGQAGFQVVMMYPEKSYRLPVKFFSQNVCALVKAP